MRMRFLPVLLTELRLSSCSGRGAVISAGAIHDNTPEYARAHVVALITRDLDARLGPRARADVVLVESPRWIPSGRRQSEGWYWDQASVQVDLVGDAGARPELDERDAKAVVIKRLRPSVLGDGLLVRVSALEDAKRFARLARVAEPALVATTPPRAPRRYTVQAGDTWADLSTAFYGSAQHWRVIREANPEVRDDGLRAGLDLTIPPQP